jgi:hypothetical protein
MTPTKRRLTTVQTRRAELFDRGLRLYQSTGDLSALILCIHHPNRIVNRSGYVLYRKRLCGSCKTNRRRDGTPRPAHVRNSRARSYTKSMELRRHFCGRMRGWRLVERLFGKEIVDMVGLIRGPV